MAGFREWRVCVSVSDALTLFALYSGTAVQYNLMIFKSVIDYLNVIPIMLCYYTIYILEYILVEIDV
jgi:hypothetical protein